MTKYMRTRQTTFIVNTWCIWVIIWISIQSSVVWSTQPKALPNNPTRVVVLGGSGRIGTAVAIHLLRRDPQCVVTLVSRRHEQGQLALQEVLRESQSSPDRLSFSQLDSVWADTLQFREILRSADCVIHTAGPYMDQKPIPLKIAMESKQCRVYVDVSDPLPYLDESLSMTENARKSNLTAMIAAGAFPGMSNVLAKEASQSLGKQVQDVRFNYFTAGLGGSGVVNLYITNLGFGEPMVQYYDGKLRWFKDLSGILLGKVDFFLPLSNHPGNEMVRTRVGSQTIFAWPFPEAATVAKDVSAQGISYAAMGTAPDVWNTMLGVLVNVVPRPWWRNKSFSKFMADFSQPLVLATDFFLRETGTGETHTMRVDVTSTVGLDGESTGVSIVQAHDSFRHCVGQSCAEFALDLLKNPQPGVYLPEQFYKDSIDRSRIIEKLTTTPGTFCYTGPITLKKAPNPPTSWKQAISQAMQKEAEL